MPGVRGNTARQSRNSRFKIPNSRTCNKNDSRQESLRVTEEFADGSTENTEGLSEIRVQSFEAQRTRRRKLRRITTSRELVLPGR
jgi:hypothetical protein